jgi:hypothetical protein
MAASTAAGGVFRAVYVSSSRGGAPAPAPALERILETARRENARLGVTGLLLYHDGCFFQVLEGEEADVRAVYARIARDPRHSGLILLQQTRAAARCFPEWSMGYVEADALPAGQREGFLNLAGHVGAGAPDLAADPAVQRQLATFLSGFREFAAV